jgi:hypothetical protein
MQSLVGFAALSMLLSSCSLLGKESIPELQAICDGMRNRVVAISSNYPDPDSYPQADYMATLSGDSDREALRQKILRLMPYLADYELADYDFAAWESGRLKPDSNDWRIKEAVLLMSKTPAPLVFDDEEKQKVSIAGADAYEKVVKPKVEYYLGPSYRAEGETDADGCKELDNAAEPFIYYDNQVEYQWDNYHTQMNEYVNNYFWILSCKQTGMVDGEKCSGTKYVSAPTNYNSTSEPSAEELAILEERAQKAENESRNPSTTPSYSNVAPLQGCGRLGAVVQTENYGELICKLVFLNRIRALVWMRS